MENSRSQSSRRTQDERRAELAVERREVLDQDAQLRRAQARAAQQP